MQIEILNKYHLGSSIVGLGGVYIGRGSPLGNPYKIVADGKGPFEVPTREAAIELYRAWLQGRIEAEDPAIIGELTRLFQKAQREPLKLVCFCTPKPCHGDVIKEILLQAHENQGENHG